MNDLYSISVAIMCSVYLAATFLKPRLLISLAGTIGVQQKRWRNVNLFLAFLRAFLLARHSCNMGYCG